MYCSMFIVFQKKIMSFKKRFTNSIFEIEFLLKKQKKALTLKTELAICPQTKMLAL